MRAVAASYCPLLSGLAAGLAPPSRTGDGRNLCRDPALTQWIVCRRSGFYHGMWIQSHN